MRIKTNERTTIIECNMKTIYQMEKEVITFNIVPRNITTLFRRTSLSITQRPVRMIKLARLQRRGTAVPGVRRRGGVAVRRWEK